VVRTQLIAALAVLACGQAAAFVTPSPPPGFGGSPGSWTFSPPSATSQLNSILRGPGPSVAGSGAVQAAYRLAPTAARVLAGASVLGGVALGITWLATNCFEKQGTSWVRTCGPQTAPVSDGFEYRINVAGSPWRANRELACQDWPSFPPAPSGSTISGPYLVGTTCHAVWKSAAGAVLSSDYTAGFVQKTSTCPSGWYFTPGGCVQTRPPVTVTPEQIVEEMAPKPLPSTLPPGVPYPLDPVAPSIWNPTIGDPPVTQPLRVPQGLPRPIPDTSPPAYKQPVVDVTHSPTANEPWRMDVQPKDIPTDSPTGQTGPQTIGSGTPSGTPAEKEPPFDLCKEHPDIVACQKLGNLDATPLQNMNRQLAITPDQGWGPSTAGCPADRSTQLSFGPIAFSYGPFCQFASGIRPIVIAVAWLLAAGAFFGMARRD